MSIRTARGFTYIEVLAGTLILVVGMFAIIGLIIYGQRLANAAQADATAMTTALSVAVDPEPLAPAGDWDASGWRRPAYDLGSSGAISCRTEGWVNGLHVVRSETSTPEDILGPGLRMVTVQVDVRQAQGGRSAAAYTTRLLRQSTAGYTP